MMKYLFLLIAGLVMFGAQAQNDQQQRDSIPFEFSRQAFIYEMAKNFNDPVIARMAIFNLISFNPGNTALLDTLAVLYLDNNQPVSAALTAQESATIDPKDLFAVELAAISFERIGATAKAIEFYERLYTSNFDINVVYKMGFLQMQVKRFIEASTNADIIIEDPKSEKLKLMFQKSETENQEILLKACGYRLKGMIEEDQGNTSLAKEYYQKALDMEPDFVIMKEQLEALNTK
ncbi:MAG: tetratricopeptide (TPR) repeat protein [Cyclobacteriaceae bacterium]|jgi:tetratricopeptide (TPR) repeat protein